MVPGQEMHPVCGHTMDEENTIQSILGARRSERKPPVFTPRSRSLEDLPGGIRVPIVKKTEPRLKTKLQATLAGLEELHYLRERHQKMVNEAKLVPATRRPGEEPDPRIAKGPMKAFRRFSSDVGGSLSRINEDSTSRAPLTRRASYNPLVTMPTQPSAGCPDSRRETFGTDNTVFHQRSLSKSSVSSDSSSASSQTSESLPDRGVPDLNDQETHVAKPLPAKRSMVRSSSFSIGSARREETSQEIERRDVAQCSYVGLGNTEIQPKLRRASVQCEAVLTSHNVSSQLLPEARSSYNFPSPLHAVLRQYSSKTSDPSNTSQSTTDGLQKVHGVLAMVAKRTPTFQKIDENESLETISEDDKQAKEHKENREQESKFPPRGLQRRHSFDFNSRPLKGLAVTCPKIELNTTGLSGASGCDKKDSKVQNESDGANFNVTDCSRDVFPTKQYNDKTENAPLPADPRRLTEANERNKDDSVLVTTDGRLKEESESVSADGSSDRSICDACEPSNNRVSTLCANTQEEKSKVQSVSSEDDVFDEVLVPETPSTRSCETIDNPSEKAGKLPNCRNLETSQESLSECTVKGSINMPVSPLAQRSPAVSVDVKDACKDLGESSAVINPQRRQDVDTVSSQNVDQRPASHQQSRTFPNLRADMSADSSSKRLQNAKFQSRSSTHIESETLPKQTAGENGQTVQDRKRHSTTTDSCSNPSIANHSTQVMDTNSRLMYQLGNKVYSDRRNNNLSIDEGYAPSIISSKYSILSDEGYGASVPSSKCSIASEDCFPRFTAGCMKKDNRKLSIQSDFTWISTDMDDTFSSVDYFTFSPTGNRETDCFTIPSPSELSPETVKDTVQQTKSQSSCVRKTLLETAL